MKKLITTLLLSLCTSLFAQDGSLFCADHLESIPILQRGRVKPLYVHANQTMKYITTEKKLRDMSFLKAYCLLSLKSIGVQGAPKLETKVEHVKVKELLNFKEDQKRMPLEELVEFKREMSVEAGKQKLNNSYKKALNKNLGKVQLYEQLIAGQDWVVPQVSSGQTNWIGIINFLESEKTRQESAGVRKDFKQVFSDLEKTYIAAENDTYRLELTYRKAHFYGYSMLLCLLGLFAFGLFKTAKWGNVFAVLTLVLQTIALVMRVIISGRAPITNMYETVLFSGYGALILGMIIAYTRKDKIFTVVGLCYNILCLLMMTFAHGMLDASIGPLVPVLRDNFWLSTHVTTVILSYAAFALSWILANIILIRKRFFTISSKDVNYYSDLIYTTLKYGTIMLSAGLILGGVWADYSWGRFWGWDPKETWSLIVLCIYMAILHGRYSNWINNERFVPLVALSFLSVMMAWFGVNYILAAGLHSYGFSEGGAIFLITFFAVQIAIVLITVFPLSRKSSNT